MKIEHAYVPVPAGLQPWQIEPGLLSVFNNQAAIPVSNNLSIARPLVQHTDNILALLNGEAALVPVQGAEIAQTIAAGLNLIAYDHAAGAVVGYQSIGLWNQLGLLELRSAKVLPNYRGNGLNTVMKQLAISIGMQQFPGRKFLGFTEAESKSRGILSKLGFQEMTMQQVAAKWQELSSICPDQCFIKTGHPCGCKVYILDPYETK
ncbi:MAG: hypothetical protein WC775_02875 [Patescibacteria group bacterium]|jgi:hypothetical protein